MSLLKYQSQVRLLLEILPEVAAEDCFAMHGGGAINLFVRNMPRLSVDIDLTYLLIEDRATTLANIANALRTVQVRINAKFPAIRVVFNADQMKLLCSRPDAQIKVEVNTTMRGTLGDPVLLPLSTKTQETFDRFAEMRIVPIGQLYGGKICAALDRQHPRDLFDIKFMLESYGLSNDIKRGFLLCLLSSDRPIHEIILPTLLDQRDTLENHFAGMSEEPFSYEEFEGTRHTLIHIVNASLLPTERQFLLSFKDGAPAWAEYGFEEFEVFPAVQWKLLNIRKLKQANPTKHREQFNAMRITLGATDAV
ncbi:MAG: nucleotidyl transferase AbiEii/AbiGii toxin family protein [Capsulimonadaceae bacterium]